MQEKLNKYSHLSLITLAWFSWGSEIRQFNSMKYFLRGWVVKYFVAVMECVRTQSQPQFCFKINVNVTAVCSQPDLWCNMPIQNVITTDFKDMTLWLINTIVCHGSLCAPHFYNLQLRLCISFVSPHSIFTVHSV